MSNSNCEKKKVIWLVNYYAMPPEHESRLRTIKFAQYLEQNGYNPIIISSSFLHNKNIDLIKDESSYLKAIYDNLKFIHIKSKNYVGQFWRFYSLFQFHYKLHFLSKKFIKPDYILHVCLPPFGMLTYFTSKRMKSKYFAEVLDLWPEAFISHGLISKKNIFVKLLYACEKWVYTKADKVIFSMEGGVDYLKYKGWLNKSIDNKKIHYINNGVDLNDFKFNSKNFQLKDNDLDSNKFNITYIGSIRKANDLSKLVEAAEHLINYRNIQFLIFGDGDERENLINICSEKKLKNIIFKNKWLDPKYIPFILSKSDLNVLNYSPNYIWKYGGSQSKFFQYIASGKPIISNINMGYCLISKYNIGISKNFITPKEYSNSILKLYNLSDSEKIEIKKKSELLAKNFDYQNLTNKIIKLL